MHQIHNCAVFASPLPFAVHDGIRISFPQNKPSEIPLQTPGVRNVLVVVVAVAVVVVKVSVVDVVVTVVVVTDVDVVVTVVVDVAVKDVVVPEVEVDVAVVVVTVADVFVVLVVDTVAVVPTQRRGGVGGEEHTRTRHRKRTPFSHPGFASRLKKLRKSTCFRNARKESATLTRTHGHICAYMYMRGVLVLVVIVADDVVTVTVVKVAVVVVTVPDVVVLLTEVVVAVVVQPTSSL